MKKHRYYWHRNILAALTILFFAYSTGAVIRTTALNSKVHTLTQKGMRARNESTFSVSMEIPLRSDGVPNSWYQAETDEWGAQYDIWIHNDSSAKFTDWKMVVKFPCTYRIDSSWNGFFTSSDDQNVVCITGSSEARNTEILAYEKGKVGFVLYTPGTVLEDCTFELEYHLYKSVLKNPHFYICFALGIICILVLIIFQIINKLVEDEKKQANKTISALIKLISSFIDTRDSYTKLHSFHVAEYSRKIAKKMNFDKDELQNIYYLGLLHDVGKVMIPNEILCKPGKLTDEEWEIMKKHTTYGSDILHDFSHIPNVRDAVLFHHERYDGKGYMTGLAGEKIPLVARIICVADSYDAMATDRAYRKALSTDIILSELEKNKGTQFDPKIASIMIDLIKAGEIG